MADKIIDIDAHVSEPITQMMDEYLEPEFKDRALRLRLDENGLEYLEIDGKKSAIFQGGACLGLDAGKGFGAHDLSEFYIPGKVHYYDGIVPESNDPDARIKWMDDEEIDTSFLYPTIGLFWEDECEDPRLAAAYCRAYNNWLLEFCKPYPNRLIPIAHISTLDVNEAIKEAARTAALGAKGLMLYGLSASRRMYGDPYFDSFYGEVQEMGLPLAIHTTARRDYVGKDYHGDDGSMRELDNYWYAVQTLVVPLQIALLNLINRGTFDRFPNLKVVLLESGATWVAYWLERMDERWDTQKYTCKFKLRPSEYFQRQCWVSFEPEEALISHVVRQIGAEKFFWASDFPHSDGFPGIVDRIKSALGPLSEEEQRKILSENAIEVYNSM